MYQMLWAVLCTSILVGIVGLNHFSGTPRSGARLAWFICVGFMPNTLKIPIGTLTLEMQTIASIISLLALMYFPGSARPSSFGRTDYLIALYVLSRLATEFQNNELRPLTVPSIFVLVVVPYMLGRIFYDRVSDLADSAKLICTIIVWQLLQGVIENVSRINFYDILTNNYVIYADGEGDRFGFKRAKSIFVKPIDFGVSIATLLPWVLVGSRGEPGVSTPWWKRNVTLIACVVVLTSLSRAPVLGGILALAIAAMFLQPKLRIPIGLTLAVGLFVFIFAQDVTLDALGSMIGDSTAADSAEYMIINGKPERYDGTRHRLLLYKVYKVAMDDAGLLGFGGGLVTMPTNYNHHPRFFSVDNNIIYDRLRFGLSGAFLHVAIIVSGIFDYLRLARSRNPTVAAFSAGAIGVFVMMLFVEMTCTSSNLWALVTMMLCGLSTNISHLEQQESELDPELPDL